MIIAKNPIITNIKKIFSSVKNENIPNKIVEDFDYFIQNGFIKKYKEPIEHGCRKNILIGERFLKLFNSSYPRLHSNSALEFKILKIKDNPRYQKILPKIVEIADKYFNKELSSIRIKMYKHYFTNLNSFETLSLKINTLKKLIQKYNCADCGERAEILQYNLLSNGIKAHKITMEVKNKSLLKRFNNDMNNHSFVVIGMKDGAILTNPKTWGNKAVIVDAWSKICLPAKDALQYFETLLNFNPNQNIIKYKTINKINIEKLFKAKKAENNKPFSNLISDFS